MPKRQVEACKGGVPGIKLFSCTFERDLTLNNYTRSSCRENKVTPAEFRVKFWSPFREHDQLVLPNSMVWTTGVSSTSVSCDVRTQRE